MIEVTRAEIEALLWMAKGKPDNEIGELVANFLKEKGHSDVEVNKVINDLDSYQNWSPGSV